jgi:SWI/SNF-related matrix-associated actin-dependent regulator 1 of chromatin subfamily A
MGSNILLADDMGLGKTSTAIWHMDIHLPEARVLVVTPASVKYNWRKEIWACMGRDAFVQVIDGTPKDRASQIRDLEAYRRLDKPGWVIINYDLLVRMADLKKNQLVVSDNLMILRDWVEGGGLICDESHYLKNRKSLRYRIVRDMFAPPTNGGAAARILASGTPIRNLVDDLFAQVELIRPGTWTSYSDFKGRYLEIVRKQVGQGPSKKVVFEPVAAKNLDELNAVMNTLQIRRKKSEVLGLPPKMVTKPELELEGRHLEVYKAMKEMAIYDLGQLDDEENIFSPQAATALQSALRCEQIAQGFVGGIPDGFDIPYKLAHKIKGRPQELVFPDSPKMAWLVEAIETLWRQGCRPVVFSKFNAPLFWLRHKYGEDAFIMHGDLSSKTKDLIVERFQEGARKLFLCQVRIAEGFDLTTSQDELFLSRHDSPAVNAQAEDRCHRIGQRGTVNIQIPIVTNTIEKAIDKRLAIKSADAEAALKTWKVRDVMEAL